VVYCDYFTNAIFGFAIAVAFRVVMIFGFAIAVAFRVVMMLSCVKR